ncbi:MAG: cobalamin biosynthesis protein CobD [Deltaproteobacteria bacterium]|nr:MAG: cobalamin biosynthesis protein CobD [Deltaproteobacteria bacterium]
MSPWPWTEPLPHAAALALALAWDRWLGEPPARLHPVVWMGAAIGWWRRRAPDGRIAALGSGAAMVGVVVGLSGAAGLVSVLPWVGLPIATWLLTSSMALRGLATAGGDVAQALESGDLAAARAGLSSLCSRDPSVLTAEQVAAAATESVAENTSDSVVAPLFWYAVGGIPAVLAYRCANTLDAMVGYHGRLEWFGKPAARLDDLLNLVPARLTALLLLACAGRDRRRGATVMWRDRGRTESPNAGWPMAAVAGILGVRLEKPGHYLLGDGLPACSARDLRRGIEVCSRAMLLAAALLVGALVGVGVWRLWWT